MWYRKRFSTFLVMHLHDNRKCAAIFCNFANCSTQLIYCLSKCITPECRGKLSSWYSRLMYLMAKLEVIGCAVIPSGGKCNQNLWSCYTITNKTFPELMMVCGLCVQCLHRSLSWEAWNNKKVEMTENSGVQFLFWLGSIISKFRMRALLSFVFHEKLMCFPDEVQL